MPEYDPIIRAVQSEVGVKDDADPRGGTWRAIYRRIFGRDWLEPVQPPKPFVGKRICIDPGHGMGNKKPGVHDGGCEHNEHGAQFYESDIVLLWSLELEHQLQHLGHTAFLTRRDEKSSTPVGVRAARAEVAGCTHFVSFHVNDADDDPANGTETLYNDDDKFAASIQAALLNGLGLRDRGIKKRTDLAVLKFNGQAILIELGFIANDRDRETIINRSNIINTCKLLAQAIIAHQN